MLLPTSETAVLVALLIALVGWGSWVSFYKAAKRSRFEFFAYDFAFGVILASVAAAFVLGMWDSSDLTFQDSFYLTGLRKMAWAIGAGGVLALGNLLLLAGVATSGMAVAIPVALAIALAIESTVEYFLMPGLNATLSLGGAAVLLVSAVTITVGYGWYLQGEERKALEAMRDDPAAKAPRKRSAMKPLALSATAGICLSIFYYAISMALSDGDGVSPYGAALLLCGSLLGGTIVIGPFFLNFPVRGKPLTVRTYFRVEKIHHVLGLLAGVVWVAGLLGGLVTYGAAPGIQPSPVVSYLLLHGAPVLAMLWGLLVWGEFKGGAVRVHAMAGTTLVLLLAGMSLIALSPGR